MGKILLAVVLVLAIFFVVAFLVYGAFSAITGLRTLVFLSSVLVVKVGHALAFVLIFYFARSSLSSHWLFYAFIWWLMFVIGEVGQAIGPNYSWQEAIAGVISETIYFPGAAFVTDRLIGRR